MSQAPAVFPPLPSRPGRRAGALSTSQSGGIGKAMRNSLAGVAILLVIGVVSARVSLHERANERARAEKLAAAEQKLASQLRLAQEAAAARETTLRALVEEEQRRLDAERQRREAQTAPPAMASAADADQPEAAAVGHSSALISGIVLVAEGGPSAGAAGVDGGARQDAAKPARLVGSVSRVRIPDAAHPCRSSLPSNGDGV